MSHPPLILAKGPHGIKRATILADLTDDELEPYRFTATPIEDREHPTCGSQAGYLRHRNVGTPTCDGCKAAHAAYKRSRGKR